MQNNYMCPKCKGYLNVGNSVVLSVASKNNQRGIVLLSSELGDYTTKHHSSLHFAEGEKVSFYCLICQAQNKQITNSTKQNIIRHLHCLNFFVVNNFFALFCVYLLFICTFVLLIKKHTAMKATIKKSDFSFMPAGFGHYKVTYTSPATLKTWSKVISFMPLIDKTANSEAPLLKDLKELRRLAKS